MKTLVLEVLAGPRRLFLDGDEVRAIHRNVALAPAPRRRRGLRGTLTLAGQPLPVWQLPGAGGGDPLDGFLLVGGAEAFFVDDVVRAFELSPEKRRGELAEIQGRWRPLHDLAALRQCAEEAA